MKQSRLFAAGMAAVPGGDCAGSAGAGDARHRRIVAGKTIGIGVGSGVAASLGFLLTLFAAFGD